MTSIRDLPKEELLYRLLEREHGFYKRILELTQEERDLFQCGLSIKSITELMKQKKVVLGCIEEIEHALAPLKIYWSEKKVRDDLTCKRVEEALGKLEGVMKEILSLDEENQILMQTRMSKLQSEKTSSVPSKSTT
jgi:hypothetical protein